ncbi:MAG: hypothetical protein ACREHD_18575, partial [Pirellulales bacterium]
FPEYLTCEDRSERLARHVIDWLGDEPRRRRLISELARLKVRVGHGGASRRASDYILRSLGKSPAVVPRPHFLPGMPVPSSGGAARNWT